MNAKNRTIFPYRRGSGKKRGKPPANQRRQGGGGGGRRVPGSPQELLPVLQPTTKALAQVLAGNTKQSGQFVHAQNILVQAERLVDERAVDRMPPAQREEFYEQLARLKLTVTDAADVLESEEEEEEIVEEPERKGVSMERLRELAISLSAPREAGERPGPQIGPREDEAEIAEKTDAARAAVLREGEHREAGAHESNGREAPPQRRRLYTTETLRLKSTRDEQQDEGEDTPASR